MPPSRSIRVPGRVLGLVVVLAALAVAALSADANWPQFRGLQAGVAADDPALPDSWSTTENVIWKIDVPGRAWSSPIVWNDHVLVTAVVNTTGSEEPLKPTGAYIGRSFDGPMTGADVGVGSVPHRWVLYDVDFKTGTIQWQTVVHTSVPTSKHQKNSYSSETPVTDGERIYVYSGYAGLFVFDMRGRPLWSKPMPALKTRSGWGAAGSPILYKDRVYVVNDNDEQSFVAAFDKRSGEEVWRVNRDEGTNWSTPFIWENDRRTEIVTAGTRAVRSYDLDGKLLWQLSGMSSIQIPTPFARHGLLYLNSGYAADSTRPVYAIRPGASGDISLRNGATSSDHIVWSHPAIGSYNPSSLVYGDYHYVLLDRGILMCHDARTGREIYRQQRITSGTLFTASPWAYNGRIFALSEEGDTFVIQAGPEFKVLGKNSLDEMTLATPAIANGSLVVRTSSRLYRIGRRTTPAL
jgi:outer membrane protein assembly factor BamB